MKNTSLLLAILSFVTGGVTVALIVSSSKVEFQPKSLPEGEVLSTFRLNSEYVTLRRENGEYEDFDLEINKAGSWPPVFIVRQGGIFPVTAEMVTLPPVVTPEEKAANFQKTMKEAEDYGPGF